MKEYKNASIYSDLCIRIINVATIKRLVNKCIRLRIAYGLKKIEGDSMLISSLEMYKRSIERRIRNRGKIRRKLDGRAIRERKTNG